MLVQLASQHPPRPPSTLLSSSIEWPCHVCCEPAARRIYCLEKLISALNIQPSVISHPRRTMTLSLEEDLLQELQESVGLHITRMCCVLWVVCECAMNVSLHLELIPSFLSSSQGPLGEYAAEVGFPKELHRHNQQSTVPQQHHHNTQYNSQASHQQLFTHQQHSNHYNQQQQQPQWHDAQHPNLPSTTAPLPTASPRNHPQQHNHQQHNVLQTTSQQQHSFSIQSDQESLIVNTQADISAAQAQNFVQASRQRLQQAMLAPMAGPASEFSAGGTSRGMAQRRKTTRPMEVAPRGGRTGGKGLRHFSMKVSNSSCCLLSVGSRCLPVGRVKTRRGNRYVSAACSRPLQLTA